MIHDAVVHKITRRNPSLQDWPYYGIIDVLNPVATAQYQHSVTIPTKPGMAHDFRDLRFFQADGTEIPFWNESKTDGSTSFNWIKPYSPSLKNVYFFYGNREAVSQSNGDKVFEFFDDFLGSSLDATKWTDQSVSAGAVSVSGSVATLTGGSATGNQQAAIRSNNILTASTDLAVRLRLKSAHFNSSSYTEYIALEDASATVQTAAGYSHTYSGLTGKYNSLGGSWGTGSAITGVSAGTYFIQDIIRDHTNSRFRHYVDGANIVDRTENYFSQLANIYLRSVVVGAILYVDYVAIRKYTATEPVCQLNQSGLRNPAYR